MSLVIAKCPMGAKSGVGGGDGKILPLRTTTLIILREAGEQGRQKKKAKGYTQEVKFTGHWSKKLPALLPTLHLGRSV